MIIRRTLLTVICAAGVVVSLGGSSTPAGLPRWGPRSSTPVGLPCWGPRSSTPAGLPCWGPRPATARGHERSNGQAARKRKPRAAINRARTPRVSLIDEAGFKQLLTRGAPPRDRPLLVNFWATWCDPCREEFPDLVKIDADYRSKGLDFVAISLDDVADMKTAVPKFLRSQHARMPVYLLDVPDPETIIQIVDTTWQGDMPATFLYDQNGNVVYKHKGPIKPAELRAEIDKLVAR